MKNSIKKVIAAGVILVLFCSPSFAQEWTKNQKEVWSTVNNWWQAYVDGDLSEAKSIYAEDFRGWHASDYAPTSYDKALEREEYSFENRNLVFFKLHPFAIDIRDDIAIVFYSSEVIEKDKNGSGKTAKKKWVESFQNQDGKWLCISSTSFDRL